jgi:uncharacterized protein
VKKILDQKYHKLLSILKEMNSALLAYSGGVDSTFLLKSLKDSGIKFLAVTANSETMPEKDFVSACEMARLIGAEHKVIRTEQLKNPDFIKNSKERCLFCKDELFFKLSTIAKQEGYAFLIDGSNSDDLNDWRPGMKAAQKYGVRSPLIEAGLTKNEIRTLSKSMGLSTWSRPSSPCLSSRFPYGITITKNSLRKVERAETVLDSLGFTEFRVRYYNDMAKIEVKKEEIEKLLDEKIRKMIIEKFREIGFKYTTLDLEGFKSGRLNQ